MNAKVSSKNARHIACGNIVQILTGFVGTIEEHPNKQPNAPMETLCSSHRITSNEFMHNAWVATMAINLAEGR